MDEIGRDSNQIENQSENHSESSDPQEGELEEAASETQVSEPDGGVVEGAHDASPEPEQSSKPAETEQKSADEPQKSPPRKPEFKPKELLDFDPEKEIGTPEPFEFDDDDIVSNQRLESIRQSFVPSSHFDQYFQRLKSEHFLVLSGKRFSGKKTHALMLAQRLIAEEIMNGEVLLIEGTSEQFAFDTNSMLNIKAAAIVFADMNIGNISVSQHIKTAFPNRDDIAKGLLPKLEERKIWLIFTLNSTPGKKFGIEKWASEATPAFFSIEKDTIDLKAVFDKKILEKVEGEDEPLYKENIGQLAGRLKSDQISFSKEPKKLVHLSSAADVVMFVDTYFISVMKSLSPNPTDWQEHLIQQALAEKAQEFLPQREGVKNWFDELEPEYKCAVTALALFDNCPWPLFWDFYEQIRLFLFPPPPENQNDGKTVSNERVRLKPVPSFLKKDAEQIPYDDMYWMEKTRACTRQDPTSGGAHIIDFINRSFKEEVIQHLLNFHRYELLRIIKGLHGQVLTGSYHRRWAIARAIGKIGELDFSTLVVPALLAWVNDKKDHKKKTLIHLYRSILQESKNEYYQKNALNYIVDRLAKSENLLWQWSAINLCREIGTWDELYLEKALSLLKKIIRKGWRIHINSDYVLDYFINYEIDKLFVPTVMYTLREFSYRHTVVPILIEIKSWLSDPDIDIRAFAAFFVIGDKQYGLPWQYCNRKFLDDNYVRENRPEDRFEDKFLHLICSQRIYRNLVRDILVDILRFIEIYASNEHLRQFFSPIFSLLNVWLRESVGDHDLNREVKTLIKGIAIRLPEGKPASKQLQMIQKKWAQKGL